jgi:adapter protein MecA 1/2
MIMKIERINDNQIRATLTGQDLAERHLQLSELAYGSDKAKLLFRDLMQQASYELGFEADDIPLMIEAIPLSGGSIILNVTKVEYPEELDSRFSNFTDFGDNPESFQADHREPPTLEGADGLLDLFRKLGAAAASLHHTEAENPTAAPTSEFVPLKDTAATVSNADTSPITAAEDIIKLFSFHSMDHIVRLAHVLDGFYQGENSLFLDTCERVYYLVLHKGNHTPSEFNKVCNILSEYAMQNRYVPSAEAYFDEHFQCILADSALQRLAHVSYAPS